MQLKITYPRATVRSFYPSPHLLVLFSEVVLSLFVTYIYHIQTDMFITLFIHNIFLLSASICFFSVEEEKELQGNIFYNGRGADW